MATVKLSADTSISIKDFVKKVMKPATRKTENSIVKTYDPHDPVRIGYSYNHLKGGEIIEAVNRYPGKINKNVAENKIQEIAQIQARLKARNLEVELESRGGNKDFRGERKRAELENMRAELDQAQKAKIKQEAEAKKKRNIERTKASEQSIEDLPID